jgi:glycosyltransferase involved in cell wall biosynthesis
MRPSVAVLAPRPDRTTFGGAERFYIGLREALRERGYDAEIIEVFAPERSYSEILSNYVRCSDLDLSRFSAIISTKAPAHACSHRIHLCYLQHLIRVYYDMFDLHFLDKSTALYEERKTIWRLDSALLQPSRVGKVLCIGNEVVARLALYNEIDAELLYQGLPFRGTVAQESSEDYVLFLSRLHPWKRPHLALDALRLVRSSVRLVMAGEGEEFESLRQRVVRDALLRDRVVLLGRVSEARLPSLYRRAKAILFIPIREDFGLIMVEAFNNERPVITCSDSGEPARVLRRFNPGIVVEPSATAIAIALDRLAGNPAAADGYGRRGRDCLSEFDWAAVGNRLDRELWARLHRGARPAAAAA